MDLGAFLKEMTSRRRETGQHDCCTFPAEWCIANGWPDPMAHWRGSYATEEDALALIGSAGGLAALFEDGMAAAGIPAAFGDPLAGDVGVLGIGGHEAGAIFTGKRWALVADAGLACASVDPSAVLRVWRP